MGTIEVDGGYFDKVDSSQGGKKWSNPGFVLKGELTKSADSNILDLQLGVRIGQGSGLSPLGKGGAVLCGTAPIC